MGHQRLVDVEPLASGTLVLRPLLQHVEALLQLVAHLLRDQRLLLVQQERQLLGVCTDKKKDLDIQLI